MNGLGGIDISAFREGNRLEAKTARGGLPESFWESYSAFANSDGGVILLGVKEDADGKLSAVGLDNAAKMKQNLWNGINNRQKISANLLTDRMVRIEVCDGKEFLVVDVPRADRTSRPVYKGQDPRKGTYRRNGEGDYLCSPEEVAAFFRDAALYTQDTKVLDGFGMDAFCGETIRSYRQVFKVTHPSHLWNELEDEVFLRRIGAMALGGDGQFHPTCAGLLMFGYEYEITREFPNYFLDYQENRQVFDARWTDRLVSSSGDWSGNLFDFVWRIVPKLTADLKVPFALKGMRRIDDTPVHKALREAVTNACVHADYYGRRGVVIMKNTDAFVFANPGSMRVPVKMAMEGGVSDPRNALLLKMFSLINYGERAGSGLNGIGYVWKCVYGEAVRTEETASPERFTLTLSASLQPNSSELLRLMQLAAPEVAPDAPETAPDAPEVAPETAPDAPEVAPDAPEVAPDAPCLDDRILIVLSQTPNATYSTLSRELAVHRDTVKRHIKRLVAIGRLRREGSDRAGHWVVL